MSKLTTAVLKRYTQGQSKNCRLTPTSEQEFKQMLTPSGDCLIYDGPNYLTFYDRLLQYQRVAWYIKHRRYPTKLVYSSCGKIKCCEHIVQISFKELCQILDTNKNHYDYMRGTNSKTSKLTNKDITEIFNLRAQGLTQKAIAAKKGISQVNVSYILSGKRWRHLSKT